MVGKSYAPREGEIIRDSKRVPGLMCKAALEKQLRQLKKVTDRPAVKPAAPATAACVPPPPAPAGWLVGKSYAPREGEIIRDSKRVPGLMCKAALEKQLRQLKKVTDLPAVKPASEADSGATHSKYVSVCLTLCVSLPGCTCIVQSDSCVGVAVLCPCL